MHGVVDPSVCQLTEGDISYVIQMAWEDRTSFETIQLFNLPREKRSTDD